MSVYAIGDLQGCLEEFEALLAKLKFSGKDKLWLVGDLINRGPHSLEILRRVKKLQDQCVVVLGNHDLHFLAAYFGGRAPSRSDTFTELLAAPDVDELAHWLRKQKLFHVDKSLGWAMSHAGVPHVWSIRETRRYAAEVERVLAGRDDEVSYTTFFKQMYGDKPNLWSEDLTGMTRYRLIVNYLTRLRLVDDQGAMDFTHKGTLSEAPVGLRPWFEHWPTSKKRVRLVFGHWAALDGETGREDIVGIDTGCVWGRRLTAVNLETAELTHVDAIQESP